MDVRKILESHKKLDDRIQCRLEEIAHLRAIAEYAPGIKLSESHATGTHSDRVGKYAVRIADLENRLDRQIDYLVDLKERIMTIATSLNNPTERIIIERIYLLHETKETVAEKLNYSVRHINRMHKSALEKLQILYSDIDINDIEVN